MGSTGINDVVVRGAKKRADSAHAGAKRDNGKPYATHPHAVACILRERGHDKPSVLAAAYLHDVLEDTDTPRNELVEEFGEEIVGLVDQLTNIGPADRPFEQKQAALLEHARRMSPDAKLVKLADRLHNLSEIHIWPGWKQERYAKAAMELLEALHPVPDERLAEDVRQMANSFLSSSSKDSSQH